MTWTKLGDEWPDEAAPLSDAAFRTHIEALCWSNRRGLDLLVPKRDVRRFAESVDVDAAIVDLVAAGWWREDGEAWHVGQRFPDWQLERAVVDRKREQSALTTRRSRLHKAGDHSLCLPGRCPEAPGKDAGDTSQVASQGTSRDASRQLSPGTGRDGTVRIGSRSSNEPPMQAAHEPCRLHPGQHRTNCRGCAADAKAAG